MIYQNNIIELYKSGLGSTTIARKIGLPKHKVLYILKKNNISLIPRDRIIINDIEVCKLYEEGYTISELSKKFSVCNSKIKKSLLKNNIKTRKKGPKRIIELNDSFFEKFNAVNSYWGGFIASDGSVDGNSLSIKLQRNDYEHLYKFKQIVDLYNSNVIIKNDFCIIRFRSDYITEHLEKNFSIIENKSLVLKPPNNMPNNCESHFIRGYFDGDGCISKSKSLGVEFYSGSIYILKWIKEKIQYNINGVGNPNILGRKNSKTLRLGFFGNKQVIKIMNWLYKNCDTNFLERKKNKYNKFLKIIN